MKKTSAVSGWLKKSDCVSNITLIMITASLILSSYFLPMSSVYAESLNIAVLPFEINADQNLDFLKNGIQDMLGSRLSFKDQVRVIDKESVQKVISKIKGFSGESFALLAGGQLKADFVIIGSVTIIGNSASIDSKLIDISGKTPPISFFRQSTDQSGVIPAINQFATTINETIFNRSSNVVIMAPQATQVAAQPQTSMTGSEIQTSLPEKKQQLNSSFVMNKQSGATGTFKDQVGSPNPEFSVTNNIRNSSGLWKSQIFKEVTNGIAVADTDKDNLMETVLISDHALYIYRFSDSGRFIKTAEPVKSKTSTYIGVDAGDINGNGVEEIFVTSLNPDKNMPNSFVIEYDGSKYVNIAKNSSWYFRIIKTKGDGKILLGQQQKSKKHDIYAAPIYKMKWDGKEYIPDEKLLDSDKANVISATFNSITEDNTPSIIAYDKAEHIAMFNRSGSVLWRDLNRSGGNMKYFHLPKEAATDTVPLQYFPLPVRAADINGDGTIEILYASNNDITGGYLSRFRKYSKGVVNCSFWTNSGLALHWSTPEQPGRISDFVVEDFDNDGAKELVLSNVIKDSLSTFSDSESMITVYELMQ